MQTHADRQTHTTTALQTTMTISRETQRKVLVLAEHDHQHLKAQTLHVIQAASLLADNITVLVAGKNCASLAQEAARLDKVTQVYVAESDTLEHALAEEMAALIVSIANAFTHILAPATTYGKNILPRVAALLDVGQISDVINIVSQDTFVRPLYAGNALATVQSLEPIKLMTIRTTAFSAVNAVAEKSGSSPVEYLSFSTHISLSQFIRKEETVSVRPELSTARIVISGGRGLLSKENFALLETLADTLGAAVGASRAAVDAGFVPNDYQIGQTGKVIAPDLYIAVGISGAIQHLSGMKDSKVIVAINKDADAPIFQVADYGLVGDLFQILPELNQELTVRKPKDRVK